MRLLHTAGAFLRREILEELSYPMRVVMGLCAVLVSIAIFAVFADFAGDALQAQLGGASGGYLAFALVGLAFHNLIDTALRVLSGRIRAAQVQGSLEAILASRARLSHVVICLPLYPLLRSVGQILTVFILAEVLLDVDFVWSNFAAAATVFALTLLVFASFGLLFAALTVVYKRTEPVVMFFNAACFFLGGVLIPVDKLPEALQWVSAALPMTPALSAFRIAALEGGGWDQLTGPSLHLLGFALVLIPAAVIVFRWSIRRAMRDGSLSQF